MAIAYDAAVESAEATSTFSWTHTPVGTPRGVIVFVISAWQTSTTSPSDTVTGVTYGGVSMTEVAVSPSVYDVAAADNSVVYAYFLGSGLGTGSKTVEVTLSGATGTYKGHSITVTADDDTSVVASEALRNQDDDPSDTLALSGETCFVALGAFSGLSNAGQPTNATGWSKLDDHDFGGQTCAWFRYNTVGSSDVTYGVTTSAADDNNIIVVAIKEGAAGGGAVTVTAEAGSYTLTGTAATLKWGHKFAADAGAYTLTGTAATLRLGRALAASGGSYTLTGAAAALTWDRVMPADAGSYTLSGTDATLTYTSSKTLAADAGSYTITGTAATLRWGHVLAADAGSYSLTGTDATLTYSPVGAYLMPADAGSYSLTGAAATLRWAHKLAAEAGSYTLGGTAATLRRGLSMAVDAGSYSLTGTPATFPRTYVIAAEEGVYTLTGTAATFSYSGGGLTLEQKCDLMLKLLMNKTVTDPDTGVMTVYDDDDVTPIYTANVFEDAAGTIAYRGQGIERRDRFTQV